MDKDFYFSRVNEVKKEAEKHTNGVATKILQLGLCLGTFDTLIEMALRDPDIDVNTVRLLRDERAILYDPNRTY